MITGPDLGAGAAGRRARAPRELELIALRLFAEQGFDETTVDQIAAAAGVSRRTFFRYFDSKPAVLWSEFDREVDRPPAAFEALPDDVSTMDGGPTGGRRGQPLPRRRRARTAGADEPDRFGARAAGQRGPPLRRVGTGGQRLRRLPRRAGPDSLYPLAIGRTTLAACRAAYDLWATQADADLTVYLDAALRALAAGFATPPTPGQATA